MIRIGAAAALAVAASLLGPGFANGQTSDVEDRANEYRISLAPTTRIREGLAGFSYLTFIVNPEKRYETYELGFPGLSRAVTPWFQVLVGMYTIFTDYQDSADQLELRPWVGSKVFIPNGWNGSLYNFSRLELREIRTNGTGTWAQTVRLRSRQGATFPFSGTGTSDPGTFYVITDVEVYYVFDSGVIDPLHLRGGLGYVVNDRLRLEFIYAAEFTRPEGSPLRYTDNAYRVNIKLGLQRGLLQRVFEPDAE